MRPIPLLPMLAALLVGCTHVEKTDPVDSGLVPGDDTGGGSDCVPTAEVCDGEDNDCDGEIDNGLLFVDYHADSDGDGFGAEVVAISACTSPGGTYTTDGSDCDDGNLVISPAAAEICDGIDNDCDGMVDDADSSVGNADRYWSDADGDGYGSGPSFSYCDPPAGVVENDDDCDDANIAVHPGGTEICDHVDNDCDGAIDDDDSSVSGTTIWYVDNDGDGYGLAGDSERACEQPAGTAALPGDCDDREVLANPGLTEICDDLIDNDCDGTANGCRAIEGIYTSADAEATVRSTSSMIGERLSTADLDGDGNNDIIASNPYEDSSYNYGAVWAWDEISEGDSLAVTDAFLEVTGSNTYNYAGFALGGLSDVGRDGYDDLMIGSYDNGSYTTYLLFGPLTGSISTDEADSTANLSSYEFVTYASGDFTGDGQNDLVVGDGYYSYYAASDGRVSILRGPVTTMNIEGAYASVVGGYAYSYLGSHTANAGDTNGDGYEDLLMSGEQASYSASYGGAAYLMYGPLSGYTYAYYSADIVLYGSSSYEYVGSDLAGLGDSDGDGYDDIVIGSRGVTVGSYSYAGAASVFLGPISRSTSYSGGDATYYGTSTYGYCGTNVDSAGDLDDDGSADVVLGCSGDSSYGSYAGAAYVFYGPHSGTTLVTSADASIYGRSSGMYFGSDVLGPGDLDGDGIDDLALGRYNYTPYGVFLFYGGNL